MNYLILEKPLTEEQECIIKEGFRFFDKTKLNAENYVKNYTFLIENSRYVGSLKARLSWGNFHIVEVFVVENMRGHGIGTNLIKYALKVAKKDKATFVSIKTCNLQAKKLYEELGFVVHNVMEGYSFGLKFYTLVYNKL